jgi:hypothetical protein
VVRPQIGRIRCCLENFQCFRKLHDLLGAASACMLRAEIAPPDRG